MAARPDDRVVLRASARRIDLPATAESASGITAFAGGHRRRRGTGRADSGVLASTQVAPVRAEVSKVLGIADLAEFRRPWAAHSWLRG